MTTTTSSTVQLALVGGGAFMGGYSRFAGGLGFIPASMVVPAGCLVGAAAGNAVNSLVADTAIDYKGSFMLGMWSFAGSFLAGMVGGGLGINPLIVQSGGGAAGALIGAGVGGISSYF